MAVKSATADDVYEEFMDRISHAIEEAIENGDSVAKLATRLGVSRSAMNAIRNGTYGYSMSAKLLIALDKELKVGLLKK